MTITSELDSAATFSAAAQRQASQQRLFKERPQTTTPSDPSAAEVCLPVPLLPIAIAVLTASMPADTSLCSEASRFLKSELHMQAEVGPDTLDDWRTGKTTAGCRVTAAGATDIGVDKEAVRFYERVRAAGWKRTPEPIDMPNEGALRFRWETADCLFHVNRQPVLNTMAESRVNNALKLGPGETAYQIFVVCVPAAPAKPR